MGLWDNIKNIRDLLRDMIFLIIHDLLPNSLLVPFLEKYQ